MAETRKLILERFDKLAQTDVAEFRQFFRRLRRQFPEQAAEASLLYVAAHGLDAAARSMAFWFGGDRSYIGVLLDETGLTSEDASKAIKVVKEIDPQFLIKFTRAATVLESPSQILRTLSLFPAIGDYSILIPWLRKLGQHQDMRVRSRSAKLMCELRPNKSLVERQMHSEDARVRASAVEAMVGRANREDARAVFRAALKDDHHRVVGNALVGLYMMGETDALNDMIELCAHKDHLFRSAMAWAMGFVKDVRAIPTLRELTTDNSLVVRKRALDSLLILEAIEGGKRGVNAGTDVRVDEPAEVLVQAESAAESPELKLFTFK